MVTYFSDTINFEMKTIAKHSCGTEFFLVGSMTRTCMDDDQADTVGVWSGSPPTCNRKTFQSY